jgi:hypothetical protein
LFLVKFSNYSFQFKHSHPSSIKLFNILDILDLLYAPADDILISSPCISRSWYLDTFARLCQVYKFPFHFFLFRLSWNTTPKKMYKHIPARKRIMFVKYVIFHITKKQRATLSWHIIITAMTTFFPSFLAWIAVCMLKKWQVPFVPRT